MMPVLVCDYTKLLFLFLEMKVTSNVLFLCLILLAVFLLPLSAPIILSVGVLYVASSFGFLGADVCEMQGDSYLNAPL